jgi:hypothetical protein
LLTKRRFDWGEFQKFSRENSIISEIMAAVDFDINENAPVEIEFSKYYFDMEKIGPIYSDVPETKCNLS